uniref:Aspartate--tRNA ligase, mitochondrial n=1 Tax=Schistosoma haematobium TaxID=6185 RepID=A0A095A115_SCHHA
MLSFIFRRLLSRLYFRTPNLNPSFRSPIPKAFVSSSPAFVYRSHACGELSTRHINSTVTVCGWLEHCRLSSRFLVLRDDRGLIQIYCDKNSLPIPQLSFESVLRVTGKVQARPEKDVNKVVLFVLYLSFKLMPTGEIEIIAESIEILSHSSLLSFLPKDAANAREFIVPTKFPGLWYCLPQSPQQFKQLLMISGFSKYMQIARCFRDETSRSDRQPEFTQLDIEMAFITPDDIYEIIENMLLYIWPTVQSTSGCRPISAPFLRMKYCDAMSRYGSDKPDIRFGFLFSYSAVDGHTGFNIPRKYSSSLSAEDWDSLEDLVFRLTGQRISIFAVQNIKSKHLDLLNLLKPECGDLVVFIKGNTETEAEVTLLRFSVHIKGLSIYEPGFHFLWVNQFPLFEKNNLGQWISVHHPFTAASPETAHFLYTDPSKVIGLHYDLVCNGQEVGGGSIRIHNPEVQRYIFTEILKENSCEMEYFLTALNSGAPPHGGIALGLDRLIAIFVNAKSIRDVIAFPKAADGKDLLCGTPTMNKSLEAQRELRKKERMVKDLK